jgi:hypothetical protein
MNLATAGTVSEVSSKGMSDKIKKVLGSAAVAVAGEKGCQTDGSMCQKEVLAHARPA